MFPNFLRYKTILALLMSPHQHQKENQLFLIQGMSSPHGRDYEKWAVMISFYFDIIMCLTDFGLSCGPRLNL